MNTLIQQFGPARGDLSQPTYESRMLRVRRALKREPSYTTPRADALLDVAIRMHLTTGYSPLNVRPSFGDCELCKGTGRIRWETSLGTPIGRTEFGDCPDCDGVGVVL